MAAYLAVALLVLSVIAEAEGSRDRMARSSAHAEPIRRRGSLSQRGRKKTIWSYNPGHRSLAFLVAGDVEVASPPPMESVTGEEYRCLGCCGERAVVGSKTTFRPEPSNRVGRLVLRPDGLAVIGTEPNSVNGRCLGCCEDGMTPINGVTTTTVTSTTARTAPTTARTASTAARTATAASTARAGRLTKIPGRQRPWQAQRVAPNEKPCVPPECNPNWRFESSSSSEEISVVRRPPPRSRMQPIRSRVDRRCRHLGCRSPLGSIGDDSSSSSSEED